MATNDKILKFFNLHYGEYERNAVDLFLPSDKKGELGLFFYIHGGGFTTGDKECYYEEMANKVCPKGYACATTNYRYVSDESSILDIMDDLLASVKKVKAVAAENGVILNKMLVTGGSAGAHLTLQFAYSKAEEAAIKPAAAVSYSASTDIANTDMIYDCELGCPENCAKLFSRASEYKIDLDNFDAAIPALTKISPITYVSEKSVPTVICHGMKDTVVPFSNATKLEQKLIDCNVKHDTVYYPNSGHGLCDDPECPEIAFNLMMKYAEMYL